MSWLSRTRATSASRSAGICAIISTAPPRRPMPHPHGKVMKGAAIDLIVSTS